MWDFLFLPQRTTEKGFSQGKGNKERFDFRLSIGGSLE